MALDTGKKVVSLNNNQTESNYIKPRTNLGTIARGFEGVMETYTKIAASNHESSWTNDFKQKLFEKKLELQEKHKMDPASMRASTEAYTKALLENVPKLYEGTATALLALNNNTLIQYSSNNKITDDNDKAVAGHINNLNIDNASISDLHNNAVNNEFSSQEGKHNQINQETVNNAYALINESAHNSQIHLVNNNLKNQKIHDEEVVDQIVNTEESRLFHMGLSFNSEKDFLTHMTNFLEGKDTFQNMESKNEAFSIYKKHIKDADVRNDIYTNVIKKYENWRNGKFGKQKKTNLNFDKLSEINQPLDVANFKGGSVDPNDIAENLNVDIGSPDHDKIINIVSKLNNTQRVVAKTMQSSNERINWEDEGVEPKDWATALLANQNPPIRKVKYNDLTSDGFTTAVNLMAQQDYFPSELKDALAVNPGANYKDESSLNKLAQQSEIYQYVKNLFPDIEYPGIYEQAINAGVIDEINNSNFKTATDILSNLNNDDYIKRLENISTNENNTLNFRQLVNKKVASPNFVKKMIAGGSDELNKNLFSSADQTTIFAVVPSNIMPPVAYDQLENFFYESMANMTIGKEINAWDESNTKLVDQAWNIASRKLKQSGWGIENNTFDGQPRLVKEPYAATYGEPNNNDIYSHIKKGFMTGDNIEDNFGTKDWNNINKDLSKYFDNKNNENIKISIDRQTYNDENGKPAYKLTMWSGDLAIPIEGNFKPAGWTNYSKAPIPGPVTGNMNTVINDTVNEIYKNFQNSKNLNTFTNDVGLEENVGESSNSSKRALYSVIRNGIKLSDYRFYPDIPGLDDQPKEVRPFAFVARMMGFKGDLREIQTELSTAAEIANKNLSQQTKINLNRNLSDLEKVTSATVPPEKMVMSENAMSTNFKDYALKNYQNTELRLTHRTNNWGAVSSNNWDGEIDLKYQRDGRKFAVFTHPKNSIRAATKSILNHSTLTVKLNKVDKRYGIEPTIKEILSMYAEDTNSYLNALDKHTNFLPDDTINLMNANQMHQLLKFITQHEMGFEYFNEKFGKKNPYVNSVIFRGIDEAINSYNGELGKL